MAISLSPYRTLVVMTFQDSLSFQTQFWIGLGQVILSFLLRYYLWLAIFSANAVIAGMNLGQMIQYAIASALAGSIMSSGVLGQIISGHYSGSLNADLLKPWSLPLVWLTRSVGAALVNLLCHGLPVLVVGLALVGPTFEFISHLPVFLTALALGFVINFLLEFLWGQLMFYMTEFYSISGFWNLVQTFATGALIPLPFFPAWAQEVLYALPFQLIFYAPISLLLGGSMPQAPFIRVLTERGFPEAGAVVALQICWILVLSGAAWLAWNRTKRRVSTQESGA
jgi:ABC-2 type transport system permease protein